MEAKSWHIALAGVILQFLLGVVVTFGASRNATFVGVLILIASSIGVLPALLLYPNITKKLGGVVSIIFGIGGIILGIGIVVGAFLVTAGAIQFNKTIKSWHIALLGVIAQFILGSAASAVFKNTELASMSGVGAFGTMGTLLSFVALFGIIPTIFLYIKETKKIGAILSIIFGVIGILLSIGLHAGVFALVAGILYFWKKI